VRQRDENLAGALVFHRANGILPCFPTAPKRGWIPRR
jgi:hypothetical protein